MPSAKSGIKNHGDHGDLRGGIIWVEMTIWRRYPMKPVRVTEKVLRGLNPSNYTFEPKLDGHRAIVVVNGSTSIWTRDYRKIAMPENLAEELSAIQIPKGTILDGEVWNPTKRGDWKASTGVHCCLAIWDVMMVGGRDIGKLPIEERRRFLSEIIGEGAGSVRQIKSEPLDLLRIAEVHEDARQFRQENAIRSGYVHGVVVKRNKSPRRDHATRCTEHSDWLKLLFPKMQGYDPK